MFTKPPVVNIVVHTLLATLLIASSMAQAKSHYDKQAVPDLKETPERVVALNWSATEALLLLGVTPVGVADRDGYPVWVKQPALPDGIPNVGRRSAPSLSAIAELKPDLIVVSSQLAPAQEQLERIAPTYVTPMYTGGTAPFSEARDMLLTLGDLLDREPQARDVLKQTERMLAANRKRLELAGMTDKPIALVSFMDSRHVRINARNGLFQAALEGLGLENAWQPPGTNWGFTTIGLDKLAKHDNARLVVIEPMATGLKESLGSSPFWNRLPVVEQREVYQIEPVWAYGGVYAVQRLAQQLTEALLAEGQANVR